MSRALPALFCSLLACSSSEITRNLVQPVDQNLLSVSVSIGDAPRGRISATITNIAGEVLLVPTCVDLQRKVDSNWEFVIDEGRMCPLGGFAELEPSASSAFELMLPEGSASCEYRVVAQAARAQAGPGESAVVYDRLRLNQSEPFCLTG
jgi:hypothetical protein